MINLDKLKKVYFVGVGGIGVSALARMFLDLGKTVSGSDVLQSKITKDLNTLGVEIYLGHKKENLHNDTNLLIYSPAVNEFNPEIIKAKELDIPILSYPQALGLVSQQHSLIAVSGTHGKTTTTAMLAKEIRKFHKNIFYLPDFNSVVKEAKKSTDKDILITMGAGDVWKIGEKILEIQS